MGMDCSGFVQVVMSLFGKQLLRNASQQATQGQAVDALDHAQPGDLLFFNHGVQNTEYGVQTKSPISHVGILLSTLNVQPSTLSVIHCSGRVKVEKVDETGIYSAETGDHTHHLAAIRRV